MSVTIEINQDQPKLIPIAGCEEGKIYMDKNNKLYTCQYHSHLGYFLAGIGHKAVYYSSDDSTKLSKEKFYFREVSVHIQVSFL